MNLRIISEPIALKYHERKQVQARISESVAYKVHFLDVIFSETRTTRYFFKHRLSEPKNAACTPSVANDFGNFF